VILKAGEVLFIPAGAIHSARNVGTGRAAEPATYIVEKGSRSSRWWSEHAREHSRLGGLRAVLAARCSCLTTLGAASRARLAR
jgi:hypothetical protein